MSISGVAKKDLGGFWPWAALKGCQVID